MVSTAPNEFRSVSSVALENNDGPEVILINPEEAEREIKKLQNIYIPFCI